jgi:hypothetical protein
MMKRSRERAADILGTMLLRVAHHRPDSYMSYSELPTNKPQRGGRKMNYTSEKWEARGRVVYKQSSNYEILEVPILSWMQQGEAEADTQLIVAAVNACISVNPDNPLAVAKSIQKMYDTLKLYQERFESIEKKYSYPMSLELPRVWGDRAITKAEGKEQE